jgi:hypothetical protein
VKRWLVVLLGAVALAVAPAMVRAAKTLDSYFIDVEGGQATLVVTPAGESMLIDAGFPSDDALIAPIYGMKPGASANGRDPKRILAAAKDAGLSQIDYMLVTHFHADHDGGIVELAEMLPMRTFIDHGEPAPGTDEAVPLSMANFERYTALRAKGRHLEPAPGDLLPLGCRGAWSARMRSCSRSRCQGRGCESVQRPGRAGAGKIETAFHRDSAAMRAVQVPQPRGSQRPAAARASLTISSGASTYWWPTTAGRCRRPCDLQGHQAARRRVQQRSAQGRAAGCLATVKQLPAIDGWQLHRSLIPNAENAPDDRLANLDESTSAWIKVSASEDGWFTVTNGRTGYSKTYRR